MTRPSNRQSPDGILSRTQSGTVGVVQRSLKVLTKVISITTCGTGPASRITAWAKQRETAIIAAWIVLVAAIAAFKALTPINPPRSMAEGIGLMLPFLAIAAAPVLGYRFGTALFASRQQPAMRLAVYGQWRAATPAELGKGEQGWRSFAWFSLVSGILLNVPFRAFEYLTSIPAVTSADPMWAHVIQRAFTIDCAVACFAYAMCFAAAVQRSPLFARALVAAWLIDVALQSMIAVQVGNAPGVPAFLLEPMNALLAMNLKKVAISMSIWLPYLLISDNLNLLLRRRVRVHA